MEFDEMKRNTSNWSNFCMLLRRAGLTASAGLSCLCLCLTNALNVSASQLSDLQQLHLVSAVRMLFGLFLSIVPAYLVAWIHYYQQISLQSSVCLNKWKTGCMANIF